MRRHDEGYLSSEEEDELADAGRARHAEAVAEGEAEPRELDHYEAVRYELDALEREERAARARLCAVSHVRKVVDGIGDRLRGGAS